jgi:hypothetical protein
MTYEWENSEGGELIALHDVLVHFSIETAVLHGASCT